MQLSLLVAQQDVLYSLVLADKPSVSALSAIQWLIMNFIIHIGLVKVRSRCKIEKKSSIKQRSIGSTSPFTLNVFVIFSSCGFMEIM